MAEPPPLRERQALIALLALSTLAFAFVMAPFYGAVMWGTVTGVLFAPVYRRVLANLHGRRNTAAALTLAVVGVIVILPAALLVQQLAAEGSRLVQGVQSGQIDFARYAQRILESLPGPVHGWLERLGLGDLAAIQQRVIASMGRVGQFFAGQAVSIGQDTLNWVASFFVALYVAFFMLRDGQALARRIAPKVPLSPPDRQRLAHEFRTVVRATVKGNLVVAGVQGVLGGLAFWALGVRAALLWGTVMAFASLLPALGSALVWLPVALYLVASGEAWKGLALVLWGGVVIGLVDNMLRPLLVGKDTKLPDWLVLVSTLGGMALFGINGFVIGPVAAAMFVAVWALYGGSENS